MLIPGFTEFAPPEVFTPFTAVHVKDVFGVLDVNEILIVLLLHMVSLLTKAATAVGTGFTVMV
jgi:hypothetical protein